MAWKKPHQCPVCNRMHTHNQSLCGTCYTHSRKPEVKAHREQIKASDWLEIRHRVQQLNARALPKITAGDVRDVVAKSDRHCPYCNTYLTQSNTHIDHIQPIGEGGTNSPENLELICNFCNLAKSNRSRIEFINWLKTVAAKWG